MAFPFWALASLAMPLFGGLLNRGDQQRRLQAHISKLLSEEGLATRANDIMKYFYQSPAYSHVQGLAMQAGRQAQVAGASIGAGTGVMSGMDAIRRAVSAGVGTGTLSQLVGQRALGARGEALQASTAEANALSALGPSPNYSNQLLGSSLSFLGPLIQKYLAAKYGLGGGTTNMGEWNGSKGWL